MVMSTGPRACAYVGKSERWEALFKIELMVVSHNSRSSPPLPWPSMRVSEGPQISATGSFTVMLSQMVSEPHWLVTVKQTLYVPAEEYVCCGNSCAEVFPSPKFQEKVVALA